MRALISARSCFLDRRQRVFRCSKTDLPKTNATIETFVNFGSGVNLCCWLKIKFRVVLRVFRRGSRRVSIPPEASPLESDIPQSITWDCRSAGRLYHRSNEEARLVYQDLFIKPVLASRMQDAASGVLIARAPSVQRVAAWRSWSSVYPSKLALLRKPHRSA